MYNVRRDSPKFHVSTCNLKRADISANEGMGFRSTFSRASCNFAPDNALFLLHRTFPPRFSSRVRRHVRADSFHDVDKTADEEFLFPRMSRDERKCRRSRPSIPLGPHLLPTQINLRSAINLRRTNSAIGAARVKTSVPAWSIPWLSVYFFFFENDDKDVSPTS